MVKVFCRNVRLTKSAKLGGMETQVLEFRHQSQDYFVVNYSCYLSLIVVASQ